MPRVTLKTLVPADLPRVYEFVTAYPAQGAPEEGALTEHYGQLVEHMGNIYRFQEDGEDGILWQCSFDPPKERTMRAVESRWSDRIDTFAAVPGGTHWTISWELKSRGLSAGVQWLTFQVRAKRRVFANVVAPVLEHFQNSPPEEKNQGFY